MAKIKFSRRNYIRTVLERNIFRKGEIAYYQGKTKRKNPHGIPTKAWRKVAGGYKPILHKSAFANNYWTFEKKSK